MKRRCRGPWHINCMRMTSIPRCQGFGSPIHSTETAMKRLQQGFTLIELMIVVAIVGILAAIALPAYQDYVIRSKMSEAIAAIAACKTSVAEYASSHGAYPADELTAGCSTTATPYVASLAVATGIITAATQHTGATT